MLELSLPSPTYNPDSVSPISDTSVFSGQFLTPPDSSKKPSKQNDDICIWSAIPELESFMPGLDKWESGDKFIEPVQPLDTGLSIPISSGDSDTDIDKMQGDTDMMQSDTDKMQSNTDKMQGDCEEESQTPEIGLVPYMPYLYPVEAPIEIPGYVTIPVSHYQQLCNPGQKKKEKRYTPYDVQSVMIQRRANRLNLQPDQKQTLELIYSRQRYISKKERLDIAGLLGLTDKQVMYWFQNRRRKDKKITELLYAS